MVERVLQETLQVVKKIFDKHNTLTLVSNANGRVWAGKVYFAEEDGYIYVALKRGQNYHNIIANPNVFFVIERGVPDHFIQGEGIAESLGPIEERPERHIIFRKALQLVPFAKSYPGVEVFRIRPTRLYVSDFTGDWKPRVEVEVTDEVLRIFQTELKTHIPLWKVYWQAIRPFGLTATALPVLFGGLLAPHFSWSLLTLTILGIVLLNAGVNVLSDYFDYQRGADTWRVLGSSRVLVDQLIGPRQHLQLGLFLFGLGCTVGLWLVYLRGEPIMWIGLAGGILGFFYTAPPLGLKYRALGDPAVFLACGPLIATGAYYVQTQQVSWKVAALAVPLGLLTIAILHGNNFRDIQEDMRAGYRTVAALLGPQGSSIYYLLLIAGAYLLSALYVGLDWFPVWSLLIFLTLPAAWRNIRVAFKPSLVAFTFLDLLTAQLHLLFSLMLILGIVIGW